MPDNNIDNLLRSLHNQTKTIGIDSILKNVFKENQISKKTLYNKLNPNVYEHKLNIEEFISILFFLQKTQHHTVILDEFLSLFGLRVEYIAEIKNPIEFNFKELIDSWMHFNKEHGDVQIAITESLSDYKISSNELDKIKCELAEHIQAMTTLRYALDNVCGRQLT